MTTSKWITKKSDREQKKSSWITKKSDKEEKTNWITKKKKKTNWITKKKSNKFYGYTNPHK